VGRYRTAELSDPLAGGGGLRLLTFKSPALGGRGDVTLFVPTGSEDGKNLPLVLLLHGVYGSHWAWALKGGAHRTALSLIEQNLIRPVVIAMPSDGLWGDGTGYLPHGGADYESWIVEDVVGCVTELLPCLGGQSKLFIAGLSMGGYGALRLGSKYAHKFGGISGHSSMTHHSQLSRFVEEPMASYRVAREEEEDGVLYWMKKYRGSLPPVRFDCGLGDGLVEENRRLHEGLTAEGIPHQYFEFEGGHTWEYWREHLRDTLLFFEARRAG
jgi:enterochelin esterase-like enzyme